MATTWSLKNRAFLGPMKAISYANPNRKLAKPSRDASASVWSVHKSSHQSPKPNPPQSNLQECMFSVDVFLEHWGDSAAPSTSLDP